MTLQLGKACLRVQHTSLALDKPSGTFSHFSGRNRASGHLHIQRSFLGSEIPTLTSSLKSWVLVSSVQVLGRLGLPYQEGVTGI